MGWIIVFLIIVFLIYRAFCTLSKPQRASSFAPPAPSPRYQHSRANFEQEVNALISGMRCSRCNTGDALTYKKQNGSEAINCCCESFLKEIMTRIKGHFSTDRVVCVMTYFGNQNNLAVPLIKEPGGSSSIQKMSHGEPEILITYVDAEGRETTRMLSNLRYSTSYYFKAYCHLREDERSFCPKRIKQAVDLRTGELLDTITVKWGDRGKTRKFRDIGWD
jgi:hypothetical protein